MRIMKIESENMNLEFMDQLRRELKKIYINLERRLDKGNLDFNSKVYVKKRRKILQEMMEIEGKLRENNVCSNYIIISLHKNSDDHYADNCKKTVLEQKKEYKKIRKQISKLLPKLQKMNRSLQNDSYGSSYEINYENKLLMKSNGDGIEFKPLYEAFGVLIDDVLMLAKKQSKHQTKKSINKKNINSNDSLVEISKNNQVLSENPKIETSELLNLTKLMISISNKKESELFSTYESGIKKEDKFDNNKLIEYKKQYKEFQKFFNNLSLEERKNQINTLKSKDNMSPEFLEMIFGTIDINTDNFDISCLSPDSLLELVNKNVRIKMFEEGYYYYGKYWDVHLDKPLDRDYEICGVTRYMELNEIVQIYNDIKSTMGPLEYNDDYFRDLQKNFAMAIYYTLVNREYIKENEKTKDSIIYEICTKILNEEACLFKDCANTEKIDLISVINSKKYDIAKSFFEKESSFGRLKRNINNIQKDNENAKKL